MMLDPIYDIGNPNFRGQFFRKNLDDIMKNGGLWEKAKEIYPIVGGEEKTSAKKFVFDSGAELGFSHLENESESVISSRFLGLSCPFWACDEINQLKFSTVMFLLTSNRNAHGIRNRLHGSCNPDPDSWVRKWLDWYIGDDGYIIPERDGVIRYFFLAGKTVEDVVWGNTKEEVYAKASVQIDSIWDDGFATEYGMSKMDLIKDFVFIKGSLLENRKLVESDPSYLANISQGTDSDRARNLQGSWDIKEDGEEMITRSVLNKMFENTEQTTGRKYLSIDVALQGSDSFVAIVFDGLHMIDVDIRPFLLPDDLKAVVKRIVEKHSIREEDIYYDAVGNGQVMGDFKRAYPVQPNARPLNDDESFDKLKSQIMWQFGSLLLDGKISIDESLSYKRFQYGKKGMLSVREIMQHERKALKIDESDGKTRMIGKKAMKSILGHSPDFLESCVYGIIHTLIKKKGRSVKKGLQNLI